MMDGFIYKDEITPIHPSILFKHFWYLPIKFGKIPKDKMAELPTGTVTVAVILSVTSFSALLIGVPLMLNDLVNLQLDLGLKSQAHLDTSNAMWRDIMKQGETARHEQKEAIRKRRNFLELVACTDGSANVGAVRGGGGSSTSPACPQGPRGSPGQPGTPGEPGQDGQTGASGVSGLYEAVNAHGSQCPPCPTGPPGPPGYKGKRGIRGEKGPIGPPGSPGREGHAGDEGPEGEIGLPGDLGEPGPRGPPGETGIGYAKGEPGPKGEHGPPGEAGEEGPPGERGEDAPPGPPGIAGPPGEPGEIGKEGAFGLPGPAGAPGADAEYCPCPERSNGEGPGRASYPADHFNGVSAPRPQVAASSARPAAPQQRGTAAGAVAFPAARPSSYNKVAHAAALRTRHLS